jgi:ankyrin repeat protein
MIAASGAGDVAVMELLLSRGANIDEVAPGAGWRSPLVAAVAAERLESVKFLIDRGVDINRIYNDVSVNGFNVEIPKFTIQLVIVLYIHFQVPETCALLAAVDTCNKSLISFMLQHGADPDVRLAVSSCARSCSVSDEHIYMQDGTTLFSEVCYLERQNNYRENYSQIIELLIDAHVDIDAVDNVRRNGS